MRDGSAARYNARTVEGTSKSPQPSLSERFARGDKGALARAISWAENNDPRFPALFAELWPKVGRARRIGVTGPPGAGKSTLVNELARATRARGRTVGILAVDPSEPFAGGALLGERPRESQAWDPRPGHARRVGRSPAPWSPRSARPPGSRGVC